VPDAYAAMLGGMDVPIKLPANRKLCSTIEAAEIYGCSGTHVRGMASRGEIWSQQVTQRAWLYDIAEIQQLAKEREKLRAAGKLCGRRPGHRKSA